MESTNAIKTLFEYTSTGYEEAAKAAADLLAKIAALKKEDADLTKQHGQAVGALNQLIAKWEQLNKTMGAGTPKEVREFFAQLPKLTEAATAALAKNTAAKDANTKAQDAETKKLKDAQAAAETYKKVTDELAKGLDNAAVSTSELTKVKKLLNTEMGKTNVGSEQYVKYSKDLAQVQKAMNDVSAAQKQQVKEQGVAEDSVAALRLKVSELNKEWLLMSRTDPNFKAKADKLKAVSDELKVAEEAVGIFSRSVGNYEKGSVSVRKELRQLTQELAQLTAAGKGSSAEAEVLRARAGELRDAMDDATNSIRATASDTKTLDAALGAAELATSAYAGALALAGVEGENAEEAQKKLQQAMAALMAVQGIQNQLQKESNVMLGVSRIQMAAAAKATALKTAAEMAGGKATIFATIQQRIFNAVANANPYVLLATALITVVGAFAAFSLGSKKAKNDQEQLNRELEITGQRIATIKDKADFNIALAEASGASVKELRKLRFEAIATQLAIAKATYEIVTTSSASTTEQVKEAQKVFYDLRDQLKAFRQQTAIEDAKARVNEQRNRESAAKDAASAAKSAQDKANADYIRAMQDRMKAAEDVAKAEADGDTEAAEHFRDILAIREADLEAASKKRLTLSQLEKDELELAEYQHQKALDTIREEAETKRADDYLKAVSDVRAAQASLLEAQKRGNADEITLYQRQLDMRKEALAKFNADEIALNEEQQLFEDMAAYDHQQKIVADYIALQTQISELQQQYAEAQTQAEREAIQIQIDLVNTKVVAQVEALQALGVEVSNIPVAATQAADTARQSITEQLAQSLAVIEQFSGKSKNSFFKLASSITALVGGAFDISAIRKKYGDDAEGIKAANAEITKSMSELGAAVAISGLNAVTDSINASLEAEKSAIDDMFAYQEARAQSAYEKQSNELKSALGNRTITETKYRLEQMKLDDKKAKADKQRERDKANTLYAVELKQFNVDKAKSATMAAIATALGIMQGYAQTGPIAGSVFAGIVGALGAVQIAAILAQKPPEKPKFEKGGGIRFEGIEGPSHSRGGVPIRFGNKVVAEAEGDEGALIVSKKAMRNPYMRRLLSFVEAVGADISGSQANPGKFAEGGELSFKDYDEDFFLPARNGLQISNRRKRSIVINGQKVKLKKYGFDADMAIDAAADDIAIPLWNAYIGQEQSKLDARNAEIEAAINEGIGQSEALRSMGVTDLNSYNQSMAQKEDDLKYIDNTIKAYEELANASIEALKTEMQYEQKLAEFAERREAAATELATTTEEFNKRVLKELLDSGQITVEEYENYLDQIVMKYGATTKDIIALKREEVNAVIAAINELRAAELEQVQASFEAASVGGGDPYAAAREKFVEGVMDDITDINRLIGEMTDEERENLGSIIALARELEMLDQRYRDNETALTDGIVTSREERQKMIEEQRALQKEIDLKTKELEEAGEASADGGGGASQAALEQQLEAINKKYDEQVAAQQEILDNLDKEIADAQLLHDKKMAYIAAEENALKDSFESQKAEIESWLAAATAGLRSEATGLAQAIAALRVAGMEAGMNEYGKAADALEAIIGQLEATGGKKYATGGAIEMGSGLFQVSGPSHSQGGVPVSVGGVKVAEVEGVEKMFAVNKLAAHDPEMIAALSRASDVNARYTGVPLLDGTAAPGFTLDYDLLAAKIGAQINARPVETFITHRKIEAAYGITQAHKKASFMK
jgi:hypothetical protein